MARFLYIKKAAPVLQHRSGKGYKRPPFCPCILSISQMPLRTFVFIIISLIGLQINCEFVKSWHFFVFFTGIIIYKGGRALNFSFPARLRGGSNGLPPFCGPGPYGPGDMSQSLHEGLEVPAGGISRKPAIAPTRGTKI